MILIWVSTGSVAAGSNSESGFVVAVVTDISSAVSEDKLTNGYSITGVSNVPPGGWLNRLQIIALLSSTLQGLLRCGSSNL